MDQKPLIVITGATGAQGGSVLRTLAATNKYRIRAITRNAKSEKALNLLKLSRDIELFELDVISHCDKLAEALHGAYGAYLMTDYWADPELYEKEETNIGKKMIDVAVKNGITHVLWSTLPDVEKITNGRLYVPHCTNKARVQQYAEQLSRRGDLKTTFTYLNVGCYYQNFVENSRFFYISDQGLLENRPTVLKKDVKLPFIDIDEDFGRMVITIFENKMLFANKTVPLFSSWATMGDLMRAIAVKLGREWKYNTTDPESFQKLVGRDYTHMVLFFNSYLTEEALDNDLKQWYKQFTFLKNPEKMIEKVGLNWILQAPTKTREQLEHQEVTTSTA